MEMMSAVGQQRRASPGNNLLFLSGSMPSSLDLRGRVAETSDATTTALELYERATLQVEGQVMVEGPTETAISEP